MNKNFFMKGGAVIAIAIAVASCGEKNYFDPTTQQQEFNANFINNVMGGKQIDPKQTWNTSAITQAKVTVDLNYGEEYTLYLTEGAPLIDSDVAYVGKTVVKSGETKTFSFTRPASSPLLYAALYDKNSHAIVKMVPVTKDGVEVEFSNNYTSVSGAKGMHKAVSEGNRWSVEKKNMPDLSSYKTGAVEITAANNVTSPGNYPEKYIIPEGTTWTANIPAIQAYGGESVYVAGTWTLSEEQRTNGGSVIVVGPTGTINVPAGVMLSTNANNGQGSTGMIYVEPGGKITGDGELQFSNGTQTYSYNAGEITVANININGGTLYNIGTIGKATNTTTAIEGPAGTPEVPSKLINVGQCYFTSVSGAGMSFDNACNIIVTGDCAIGNSTKMDNGSYLQCQTLHLNGSNNGGIVMYMGEAAYVNCIGALSVNNFGVWGPVGTATAATNRAIFKIGGCSYTNYTTGSASTFMLDNVELILPENFPSGVDYGYNGSSDNKAYGLGYLDANASTYPSKNLIYGWFNGYACRLINGDNYNFTEVVVRWVQVNDYYGYNETKWVPSWKTGTAQTSFGDDSRATCIYGTSPSYTVAKDETENCGVTFTSKPNIPLTPSYTYYAFEDLGTTDDFDFNDVIIRVSAADENDVCTVELVAAGGTLPAQLKYNGINVGSEVHAAFGESSSVMVNTNSVNHDFTTLGTLTLANGETPGNLTFVLAVTGNDGSTRQITSAATPGAAPLYVIVSGDKDGKWFWPKERTNINVAYSQFGEWGANIQSNATWYANPVAGNVVTY